MTLLAPGPVAGSRRALDVVRAYVALTKPRIIELLLVATVPPMVIAAEGFPPVWLIVNTLVGGLLGAGSAQSFNSVIERDIDAVMRRTRRRPLPRHQIEPGHALTFAVVLGVASFVYTAALVNLLAAVLILAANAYYVVVYTLLLKPRTVHNVVIGGAAGCMPVVVGWAAVTGEVSLTAWLLFGVIFFWTPPHSWTLAMKYMEDYRRGGVPMLPVVAGRAETARQSLMYSAAMVAVSMALVPATGAGALYLSTAVLLGGLFLLLGARLVREPDDTATAMRLFRFSISYLGLLFIVLAVDVAVF